MHPNRCRDPHCLPCWLLSLSLLALSSSDDIITHIFYCCTWASSYLDCPIFIHKELEPTVWILMLCWRTPYQTYHVMNVERGDFFPFFLYRFGNIYLSFCCCFWKYPDRHCSAAQYIELFIIEKSIERFFFLVSIAETGERSLEAAGVKTLA